MTASRLHNALVEGGNKPFIIAPSGHWTYRGMLDYVRRITTLIQKLETGRLACHLHDSPALVAIMLAAASCGKSLVVLSKDYQPRQIAPLVGELDIGLLIGDVSLDLDDSCDQLLLSELSTQLESVEGADMLYCAADSEILILTSGTTGAPKCASYRWSDLLDQLVVQQPEADERWLLAYKLNHFAGVQMLAHVIANLSTLVLAESTRVADAIGAMAEFAVTHVSSTPTFWRFALTIFSQSATPPALRHITLGSEPVSADLLHDLVILFPSTRIVQIYALTETGSCISVSDCLPGLPETVLKRPDTATVQFRIRDEELHVKTSHGMKNYVNRESEQPVTNDGWFATGDLVKIQEGRILFIGRRSETINVGGVKVHPLEVENVISAVPGVKLTRVYGRDNPIVGQIVAVDLVVSEGWESSKVENDVRAACMTLPRHNRPRSIEIVDTIPTSNYKLVRRGARTE
ncbi:MAG: class I adenylate-forming enzyme family protein [Halioglobus sp.]